MTFSADTSRVHSRIRSTVSGVGGDHVFAPALQGDLVRHDFLIENPSETELELRGVEGFPGSVRPTV